MGGIFIWFNQKIGELRSRPNFKYLLSTFVLIGLLIICNIAFPATAGWPRLIWNIFGYLGLYIIFRFSGLKFEDIGLAPKYYKKGLLYTSVIILVISTLLISAYLIDSQIFHDQRYKQSLGTAFFAVVILLPLKTVFFEELAFRGLLPSLLFKSTTKRNTIFLSSLAFGLWHVSSSFRVGDYNFMGVNVPGFIFMLTAVSATSFAGYLFLQMRLRSKSLLAPIAVHWFINGSAIILASLSWS